MAHKDKEKWNRKFSDMPDLLAPRPPSELLVRFVHEVSGKKALDLACGGGRHTLFLQEQGFEVDAVDISEVALSGLASKVDPSKVRLIEADLDDFVPKRAGYDLIVKTNYLDRALIQRAKEALKKGGIFVIETYMEDPENEKKDSNPDFLLKVDELKQMFDTGVEILAYETFWNETYEKYRMKKAAIAVRKIV